MFINFFFFVANSVATRTVPNSCMANARGTPTIQTSKQVYTLTESNSNYIMAHCFQSVMEAGLDRVLTAIGVANFT